MKKVKEKYAIRKKVKVFSIRKSESVFIRKSESVFIRLGISGSSLAPPICKRENCDWIFIKTKKDTFQIQWQAYFDLCAVNIWLMVSIEKAATKLHQVHIQRQSLPV